jgi:hypothetical protein
MIEESKLQSGVLKLGATPNELDFSCQVTNARINSSYSDEGDSVETLCGDKKPAGRKLDGRALAGTFIQDWMLAATASITKYCFAHDLEELAFTYTPNVAADTLSGTLRVEVPAETWGGDVNVRLTSDFEWQITSELDFTPPVGATSAQRATAGASA